MSKSNGVYSIVFCSLLALQFGLQPLLYKSFASENVMQSSTVIIGEFVKIVIAIIFVGQESSSVREKLWNQWNLVDSVKIAAIPAAIYAAQNILVQCSYTLLDSVTVNVLNQTKTLSAAVWLYVLLGQPQSVVQIFALLLLLGAAVALNIDGVSFNNENISINNADYNLGLVLIMSASLLSGLSGTLTQMAYLGPRPRHSLVLSSELAVYGVLSLVIKTVFWPGPNESIENLINPSEFFKHWTLYTCIPVLSNALGGVVVGYVIKYAGGIVKGFALMAGIMITALAQWLIDGKPLTSAHCTAVLLVVMSIYLHTNFPLSKSNKPQPSHTQTQVKTDELSSTSPREAAPVTAPALTHATSIDKYKNH